VNAGGVPLGTFLVPAANNGLSFLGLVFPGEAISQVQIVSGNLWERAKAAESTSL
jgi:hypothetical protein